MDHTNGRLKALRGAVNFKDNSKENIAIRTEELFTELFKQNELSYSDIVCIIFSLTYDVTAAYPAEAFRQKFTGSIPLFSCLEPNIEGGVPFTLRVMILHYGENNKPVYLYETKNLRKDIFYENCH